MYDRILFPTDGSEGANAVFGRVLDIAETHGATLHILNVADTTHDSVTRIEGEMIDVLEREGERIVDEATDRADERNVATVTEVLQGEVPETITGYAEEYGIDLVAVPTRGRTGVERVLLGSVTENVIRRATVPVLTLRPGDENHQYPYRGVLVPTDGSECATVALERGVDVAKTYGATLHLLSVADVVSSGFDLRSELRADALEGQANQVIDEAREVAERASVGSIVGTIEHGASIHGSIQSYIDEHDVDIVVMGTHGRTGVDRYLLGSVAEKTVRTAPVPVLTVPDS